MAKSKQARIDAQPAFILHQYAYRETSKLLDVFSRDQGRQVIVARGAQRPGSQLRAVLLGFQPVVLSWFGSGEVKTLHSAEWQGGIPQLSGLPLLCGFYLNELLMRLLPKEEPHTALFVAYFEAIRDLAALPRESTIVEPILRHFEQQLLNETGYGVQWDQCFDGTPVLSSKQYSFEVGKGLISAQAHLPVYDGQSLLEFSQGKIHADKTLQQVKILMRQAFSTLLGEARLHTRQLLIDLQKL